MSPTMAEALGVTHVTTMARLLQVSHCSAEWSVVPLAYLFALSSFVVDGNPPAAVLWWNGSLTRQRRALLAEQPIRTCDEQQLVPP